MHGVYEFHEALVLSSTGAISSKRTASAQAHGPGFNGALMCSRIGTMSVLMP